MQAEMDCGYVKTVLRDVSSSPAAVNQQDSRIIVARAEANTLLEARCGVLSDAEVGNLIYMQLRKEGTTNQDPLLVIRSQLVDKSAAAIPDARNRLVNMMMDLQDPLVFSLYSGWLVSADYAKSLAYFDGQMWRGKDAEAVIAGVALSPCAFGFECGKRDIIVAVTCLQSAVCEDDRFALARIAAQKGGYSYAKVMDAYSRSVAALQNKDGRAFGGGSGT